MAISSPLQSKVPTGSKKTIKKLQGILFNRTKVKREIFQRQTILQSRREENERRKQREDELEAPNLVTKPRGAAGLIAGSAQGFFERLVGFLSYLTAGWIVNNLPTWIAMGKEFIARTQQMGKILGNFIVNSTDIFKNFTRLLGATLTNLMTFDFLDTSGRVSTAFDELNLSVENWGTDFENAIKLITTPLTEGVASGEDAPSTGTQITDEGAYKDSAPYSGSPAPQVMLEGGISGTTAMLSKGQKGADPYVGFTSGFRTSRRPSHNGIDIGTSGEKGYYVAFLLDGTATLIPNNGRAGNTVEIKSGGTTYKFFHLARFSIKSGPYKAGTAIGEIGMTGGNSTGIHLHYEVHPPGTSGVDPTPYVNLIRIGKNLGKPIASPVSVSSSSTSQPQQNLMGQPAPKSGTLSTTQLVALAKQVGFNQQNAVIAAAVAKAESGGGSGKLNNNPKTGDLSYGLWQINMIGRMGPERLKQFGISSYEQLYDPLTNARAAFILSGGSNFKPWSVYKSGKYQSFLPEAQKVAGVAPSSPSSSSSPAPSPTQSTSSPAQITPTGTPQNPQMSQSLAPERTGPTVIVSQNPSSPAQQMMSSGGGGSSGGGSSQISDFALLNNFIKNKLLLDLAYL
jgi:murein DD-endopeptidase MepM/ murein hydrolase activator NlpD